MSDMPEDPLWAEFAPLWAALRTIHPPVLLAGGYGLFLKQCWVQERRDAPIVVPLSQWRIFAPRATKDLDLLIGVEVIADEQQLELIGQTLQACGFVIHHPRWQFIKRLPGNRTVLVDLHAPEPPPDHPSVVAVPPRVKNMHATSADRVHGRYNPEAVAAHVHPCAIDRHGSSIIVPNPVTWAIMKVTAAGERWQQSQSSSRSVAERDEQRYQAIKHAADAGRVVALMGIGERTAIEPVQAVVRDTHAYAQACRLRREHFTGDGFALPALREIWTPDDAALIADQLARWLP